MTKPLTTHMVGRIDGAFLPTMAEDVTTLCGKVAAPTETDGLASYILTDSNGNSLLATTHRTFVSCQKCKSLLTIGALHANTPHARRNPNAR